LKKEQCDFQPHFIAHHQGGYSPSALPSTEGSIPEDISIGRTEGTAFFSDLTQYSNRLTFMQRV